MTTLWLYRFNAAADTLDSHFSYVVTLVQLTSQSTAVYST